MKVKIHSLDLLLERLSDATGQSLDTQGFEEMSDVTKVNKKYLYEYIYLRKKRVEKTGKDFIEMQHGNLDKIAKYLQFKNFRDFVAKNERRIDPILDSCVGCYYSYVRRSDEGGFVLQSPVRISEKDGKYLFELKGPAWSYKGEVRLKHGCLFVVMEAKGGKEIHHIYKIGTREKPAVLQGVFSAVSTVFDPIGGRTLLVRIEQEFDKLSNKESQIKQLSKSKLLLDRSIASYFKEFQRNNLHLNRVNTFSLDDLVQGERK